MTKELPKLRPIRCTECNVIIAWQLQSDHDIPSAPTYCYICIHDFCDVAKALGATHLPDTQDLYHIQDANDDRAKCNIRQRGHAQILQFMDWYYLRRIQKLT